MTMVTNFTLRPHQVVAVEQILDALKGPGSALVDAPTGSGKSVLAAEVAARTSVRCVYLADERALVNQMVREHPEFVTIEGHGNYCDQVWRCSALDQRCPEGCKWHGSWVGRHLWKDHGYGAGEAADYAEDHGLDCGYKIQKLRVIAAPLAAMNTTYYLTETFHVGDFANRDLVLLDEADQIQGTADRVYGAEFATSDLVAYGFTLPAKEWESSQEDKLKPALDNRLRRVVPELEEFVRRGGEAVKAGERLDMLTQREESFELNTGELVERAELVAKIAASPTGDELEKAKKVLDKVTYALSILHEDTVVSILDRDKGFKVNYVDVYPLLHENLWKEGKQAFVALSATMGAVHTWCKVAGVETARVAEVHVAHSFPVANRRVRLASRSYPNMGSFGFSKPELVTQLAGLIAAETDGLRTLVLVNSIAQANALTWHPLLKDRAFTHESSPWSKADAVERLGRSDAGMLVSYSMWRGVDLKGDLCRAVVLAKVPYASLGDPLVKARMDRDGLWYSQQTAQKLVQGAGRAVRGPDDWCKTLILDGGYNSGAHARLSPHFPEWFKEGYRA